MMNSKTHYQRMSGLLYECLKGRLRLLGIALVLVLLGAAGCGTVVSVGRRGVTNDADLYGVLLIPETNAGWAGWCFIAIGVAGGGCDNPPLRAPMVAENWNGEEDPPDTVGVTVTTSEVARVEVSEGNLTTASTGGRISVPTRAETGLPSGLRVAVVKIDGKNLLADGNRPYFIPLNSRGAVVPWSQSQTADQLIQPIPTRRVPHPIAPSRGICEIKTTDTKALAAERGSVITEVHSYSGIVGDGFITCASTSYELAGWPLMATVLISASHPGARPPSLPMMKPLLNHPGVFVTPGGGGMGIEGELYARRVSGGWLVVGKAKPVQRLALLRRLRAVVHA